MNTLSPSQRIVSRLMILGFSLLAAGLAGALALYNKIVAMTPKCLGPAASLSECQTPSYLVYGAPAAVILGLVILAYAFVKYRTARKAGPVAIATPVITGLAILMVSITVASFLTREQGDAVNDELASGSTVNPPSEGTTPTSRSDDTPRFEQPDPARMSNHPFPEVAQTRQGLDLETDPFVATSIEEQAWLDRNGYPNAEQWNALVGASDMQLMSAAEAGDKAAEALYAQRRLIAGEEGAIDDMIEMAAEGSTFSLELLSSTLAGPGKDPVTAYALSRVVEMRGNHRIALGRDMMLPKPLTASQRMEAEQLAMEFYSRIEALARQSGNGRPQVDPRPIHGDPMP